jgi:hypothetical protein
MRSGNAAGMQYDSNAALIPFIRVRYTNRNMICPLWLLRFLMRRVGGYSDGQTFSEQYISISLQNHIAVLYCFYASKSLKLLPFSFSSFAKKSGTSVICPADVISFDLGAKQDQEPIGDTR